MKPGSHMAAPQAAPTSPAKPVHKQGEPKSPRKNLLFDGFPTMGKYFFDFLTMERYFFDSFITSRLLKFCGRPDSVDLAVNT
jgi:hypothetical protein